MKFKMPGREKSAIETVIPEAITDEKAKELTTVTGRSVARLEEEFRVHTLVDSQETVNKLRKTTADLLARTVRGKLTPNEEKAAAQMGKLIDSHMPAGLKAVDEATLRVTKDWKISRYRCDYFMVEGDEVTMLQQKGEEVMIQLRKGLRLLLPVKVVEEHTVIV